MEAVRQGGDRQALHELIRQHSLSAWQALRESGAHNLLERLCADPRLTQFVPPQRLRQLMRPDEYLGDAPQRARALVTDIYALLDEH